MVFAVRLFAGSVYIVLLVVGLLLPF